MLNLLQLLRQRIFWKLFIAFWIALLVFAFGVLYAASAYLEATRARYDSPNSRDRTENVYTEAKAVAASGSEELIKWAQHIDNTELVPQLLLDQNGKDLLGRYPSPRAMARHELALKNFAEQKPDRRGPIVLENGRHYWLIHDFQGATLGRLILRPRVVATQLVLATLIGAVLCLGLAAYLTSPLRRLREATLAYGSGDFSHRVAPTLGSRRDEIVDLAHSVDTMAERIDALLNTQRGLLRDVSHELRSPLARAQVAVGLARQRVGNLADEELDRIDTEMEKLNELIGRILDFSRLDAGLQNISLEPLRLEQVLADVASDARVEADAKSCTITTTLPAQADFHGNAALIASAVENVVRNALRHSPPGSEISLSLNAEGKHWNIEVADQGPGIPEALHQKVFEPFFRGDSHRNPQGGTGLGLSIASKAVSAHGGTITLKNRSTGGLKVCIRLPLSPEKSA